MCTLFYLYVYCNVWYQVHWAVSRSLCSIKYYLDDVIIIRYVPLNLFKIYNLVLNKWAKHKVFSYFLGCLLACIKFAIVF